MKGLSNKELEERIFCRAEYIPDQQSAKIVSKLRYQPMVVADENVRDVIKLNPPNHSIKLGPVAGRDVFTSTPLWGITDVGGNQRAYAVMYVPSNDREAAKFMGDDLEYCVVPVYQSVSHGMWRILPAVHQSPNFQWYDKGTGEANVTLPFALQRAFSSLPLMISGRGSLGTEKDFLMLAPHVNYTHGYWAETTETSRMSPRGKRTPPSQLKVYKRWSPDFSQMIGPFQHLTLRYGDINLFVVPNKSQDFIWTFGQTSDDRCWVAAVEQSCPINSAGVPRNYVRVSERLLTPPEDYPENAGLLNNVDTAYKKTSYATRIPVVRAFRKVLKSLK